MFEAGRRSLAAFSSNKTRPVSSETTLMPTIADDSSSLLRISVMRICSSARVFVGFEVLDPGVTETGVDEVEGATTGDCVGVGDGDGVAGAVVGAVDLRSRCAIALKLPTGMVPSRRIRERSDFEILINL